MDGKPTRWGRWNPEYLLRPYGWVDRGVNGLEAMAFAKSAYGVTGDKKFEDGFNELLKFGYQNHLVRQKNTFPPEAIAFMKTHSIAGNMLAFWDWAEYCIWHLHPKCKVFMDGRFRSAYSLRAIDDYLCFLNNTEQWEVALTDYDTDIVFFHNQAVTFRIQHKH